MRSSKTLSIRSASVGVLIAALLAATSTIAQNRAPANTLMDIRRQFSACLEGTPIETGSVITNTFAMKSDGSLLGNTRREAALSFRARLAQIASGIVDFDPEVTDGALRRIECVP